MDLPQVQVTQADIDTVSQMPEIKALLERTALLRVIREQAEEIERLKDTDARGAT